MHTRCKSDFDAYDYAMHAWSFLKVFFPETWKLEFGSLPLTVSPVASDKFQEKYLPLLAVFITELSSYCF